MVRSLPAMQRSRFDPWVGKIPWRREWLPNPVLLPGEFHGQRTLADTTEQLTLLRFQEDVYIYTYIYILTYIYI